MSSLEDLEGEVYPGGTWVPRPGFDSEPSPELSLMKVSLSASLWPLSAQTGYSGPVLPSWEEEAYRLGGRAKTSQIREVRPAALELSSSRESSPQKRETEVPCVRH